MRAAHDVEKAPQAVAAIPAASSVASSILWVEAALLVTYEGEDRYALELLLPARRDLAAFHALAFHLGRLIASLSAGPAFEIGRLQLRVLVGQSLLTPGRACLHTRIGRGRGDCGDLGRGRWRCVCAAERCCLRV